jgi:ABC-type nickel/cobalt efflux system permease component RcnA
VAVDATLLGASACLLGSSAFAAAFTFGLRHGIDWDHIAALGDLTNGQPTPRRSLTLATLYALGHAAVVLVLGAAAILFGEQIPEPVDSAMERVVGVTLLILAAYVIVSLVKHRGATLPRSRWMLVFSGLKRARGHLRVENRQPIVVVEHDHDHRHNGHDLHSHVHVEAAAAAASPVAVRHSHTHRHVAPMPVDPFAPAGLRAACAVGMLHGIGAETPTQVLLFAAATETGGRPASMGLLVCFIVGLLCSNSLIAVAAAYGYLGASANRVLTITLSLLTAAFSLVIGTLLVANQSGPLPPLLGG